MNQGYQLCVDALALELYTSPAEQRIWLWRMFEDNYVSSFRRAHPEASTAALSAMLSETSHAIQKRLSELDAGATIGMA